MTTTINASTSSGLVNTADTSGILQLQTASTAALTIDASQNVGIGTASPTALTSNKALTINSPTGFGSLVDLKTNETLNLRVFSNATNSGLSVKTATPLLFETNDTERLRIDSSGRMTLPYQPSFRAYATTAQTPGSQVTIIFNNDSATNMFNIGSHYNTTNGRFTAPITGVYVFQVQLLFSGQTAGTGGDTAIYKNGASIISFNRRRYTADATGYGGYLESATTNILKLTAGDYITVVNDASSRVLYVNDPNWTHFAGWLLG